MNQEKSAEFIEDVKPVSTAKLLEEKINDALKAAGNKDLVESVSVREDRHTSISTFTGNEVSTTDYIITSKDATRTELTALKDALVGKYGGAPAYMTQEGEAALKMSPQTVDKLMEVEPAKLQENLAASQSQAAGR